MCHVLATGIKNWPIRVHVQGGGGVGFARCSGVDGKGDKTTRTGRPPPLRAAFWFCAVSWFLLLLPKLSLFVPCVAKGSILVARAEGSTVFYCREFCFRRERAGRGGLLIGFLSVFERPRREKSRCARVSRERELRCVPLFREQSNKHNTAVKQLSFLHCGVCSQLLAISPVWQQ